MIRVTFLGTAASRPTVGRNVSAVAVQREGDLMLFDCGEGTQRQMMRYGTGFSLNRIFVTHMHADHFLGVIGLLRTLGLQGRTDPLEIYGPPGSRPILRAAVDLGVERVGFPVRIETRNPGGAVASDGYVVQAVPVDHGTRAVGWAVVEHDRLGRFDVERARALGVPEGPLFGRLHQGESVEVDGRIVTPDEVVGPSRPGRTVVYTGDTRPSDRVVDAARGAELLIHDCTFSSEEADRARETGHATAAEAAEVARRAGVKRLVLTHLSARYSERWDVLEEEARAVFPGAVVARDGMAIEIPYSDDDGADEVEDDG